MANYIAALPTFISRIGPSNEHFLALPPADDPLFGAVRLPISVKVHSDVLNCGRSWDLTVEAEGLDVCFTHGWEEFVQANGIEDGDYLVFKLASANNFVFFHFDNSWCQQNRLMRWNNVLEMAGCAPRLLDADRFVIYILNPGSNTLNLPRGIRRVLKDFVPLQCTLQNNESDDAFKWRVVIDRVGSKIVFADGWADFARDNNVQRGEMMCFQLRGPNTFIVYHFGTDGWRKETRTAVGSGMRDDESSDDSIGN